MDKNSLKFDALEPESYEVFFSLDEATEKSLSEYPETLSRARGALHFAHLLRSAEEGDGREKMAGSYLRASLAEYVAIDEMAKIELQDEGFFLLDTDWPLPHVLKILRNFQMHIGTTKVTQENMQILYLEEPFTLGKWVVTDIHTGNLLNLHAFQASKKKPPIYSEETATKMVQWLNDAQATFGFPDLIYRGVMDACNRIGARTC
ncbi:hypothetical protein [Vreelandella sp. EE27]